MQFQTLLDGTICAYAGGDPNLGQTNQVFIKVPKSIFREDEEDNRLNAISLDESGAGCAYPVNPTAEMQLREMKVTIDSPPYAPNITKMEPGMFFMYINDTKKFVVVANPARYFKKNDKPLDAVCLSDGKPYPLDTNRLIRRLRVSFVPERPKLGPVLLPYGIHGGID